MQNSDNIDNIIDRVLFSQDDIEEICQRLGKQLTEDYAGKFPLVIGVLKGAVYFMTDLTRHMNVKMQNAEIVDVINEDGKNIHKKYQEYFDKVLLDTPCSGEGRFLTQNPKTYNSWSKDEVSRLEKLQKELIKSGIIALKSGGIMCYSTCTLNKVENENIIKWAKDNFNIELLDIDLKIKNSIKVMKKSLKILPNEMQEGFFIAKFRKK